MLRAWPVSVKHQPHTKEESPSNCEDGFKPRLLYLCCDHASRSEDQSALNTKDTFLVLFIVSIDFMTFSLNITSRPYPPAFDQLPDCSRQQPRCHGNTVTLLTRRGVGALISSLSFYFQHVFYICSNYKNMIVSFIMKINCKPFRLSWV